MDIGFVKLMKSESVRWGEELNNWRTSFLSSTTALLNPHSSRSQIYLLFFWTPYKATYAITAQSSSWRDGLLLRQLGCVVPFPATTLFHVPIQSDRFKDHLPLLWLLYERMLHREWTNSSSTQIRSVMIGSSVYDLQLDCTEPLDHVF
jgi:hypothetical protein